MPGASPPLVNTPIFFILVSQNPYLKKFLLWVGVRGAQAKYSAGKIYLADDLCANTILPFAFADYWLHIVEPFTTLILSLIGRFV